MNKLNLQLQGKGQFNNQMYDHITAFVNKLCLWQTQLINSNFAHFPNFGLCKPSNPDKYTSIIVSTKTKFESRFCDLKNQKDRFDLFAIPFSVDISTVPHEMPMEAIELQSSNMLKAKYDSVPIANFAN